MDGNTIAARITELRGSMSRAEFAKRIGVSPNTLRNYEGELSLPNSDVVASICTACGVSPYWLLMGTGPMMDSGGIAALAPQIGQTDSNFIYVPCVEARLAAGTGSLETSDALKGRYAFRTDWILSKGNTENMVLMHVTGDSMSPEIKHGDIVLIDQGKREVYAYGYYAVGIEDAIYIKQVSTKPGQLILRSLNPAYEPIIVNMAEEQPKSIRLIGRVIWVGRDLF